MLNSLNATCKNLAFLDLAIIQHLTRKIQHISDYSLEIRIIEIISCGFLFVMFGVNYFALSFQYDFIQYTTCSRDIQIIEIGSLPHPQIISYSREIFSNDNKEPFTCALHRVDACIIVKSKGHFKSIDVGGRIRPQLQADKSLVIHERLVVSTVLKFTV